MRDSGIGALSTMNKTPEYMEITVRRQQFSQLPNLLIIGRYRVLVRDSYMVGVGFASISSAYRKTKRSDFPIRSSAVHAAVIPLLVFFEQTLHDTADICVRDCDRIVLIHHFPHSIHIDGDINDQRCADQKRRNCEENVNGDWVASEIPFHQRIDTCLREVDEARETDDCAVDATESGEPKDFGRVVGHGGIVERAEDDEENNVDVAGP